MGSPALFLALLAVALMAAPSVSLTTPLSGPESPPLMLRNANSSLSLPASVPSVVHLDLLAAGIILEPYVGYGELNLTWVHLEEHWVYSTQFEVPPHALTKVDTFGTGGVPSPKAALLPFEGIDTVADIVLNGKLVGSSANMWHRPSFEVEHLLLPGTNELSIKIFSPSAKSLEKRDAQPDGYKIQVMYITPFNFPYCASNDKSDINEDSTCFDCFLDPQWFPNCNFEDDTRKFLRKAQSHWGWDWGAGFLTSGIYRDVTLEIIDASAITDVKVETYPTDLDATPAGSSAATKPPSKFKITCTASISSSSERDLTLVASLALNSGASFTHKFGLHSTELVQEPIPGQEALTMYFRINGVPVFANGANWIPLDQFEPRITRSKLESVLEFGKDAGFNMLRIWGGGMYETDDFYDLADEKGIMLWEEGKFACSSYPRDTDFLESVRTEIDDQIRRTSFHPSVVAYSGNNENQVFEMESTLQIVDYVKLYDDTVQRELRLMDASRQYWPASPSTGTVVDDYENDLYIERWGDPQASEYGDSHQYPNFNTDTDCEDLSLFHPTRFLSEYGFTSYPFFAALVEVTDEEDWSFNSTQMFFRNRQTFPKGEDIIDHHTISVDYTRRWKLLQYTLKSSIFAPQLIMLSQYYMDGTAPASDLIVGLVNYIGEPIEGKLELSVMGWHGGGEPLETYDLGKIAVPGYSSVNATTLPLAKILGADMEASDVFVVVELLDESGSALLRSDRMLTKPNQASLVDPSIALEFFANPNGEVGVTVSCSNLSPFVFVDFGLLEGHFTHNGFLLVPGKPRNTTFIPTLAEDEGTVTVEDLQKEVAVRTPWHTAHAESVQYNPESEK
ncbi:hypothetical protein TL16_g10498 [Triparma laevis f. inornata]|uniref:beta-mannosidase n=1 Tax=Triparma laevis f. inornata TaxID=1714386 RepID=A0A9W7B8N7_9STRA|nr:hypothetical protein TL16_g10498 [Triparma laevis f. inornata]